VTLPRGSCPCNGEMIPRFDRAVCGCFHARSAAKNVLRRLMRWTVLRLAAAEMSRLDNRLVGGTLSRTEAARPQ
jgi:hypothetical protein